MTSCKLRYRLCAFTLSYDEASGQPSLSLEIAPPHPSVTLEQIFAYLAERERPIVIAIDEFQQIDEYPEKGVAAILRSQIQFSPAQFGYIINIDNTVKPIFGHQEGAELGYNPQKPGRPSHNYHTFFVGRFI